MAQFSGILLNQLSEFLVCEIGAKAMDGITYTLLLKDNPKDMEAVNRYNKIKSQLQSEGYSNMDVLRRYEVTNGYIYDLDLNTAKSITYELSKAVAKIRNTPVGDLIGDKPEQRRKKDMVNLAKYIKDAYDKGENQVEVALFNKNAVDKINVTCISPDGRKCLVTYKAYAIRHWDIETINAKLLMPAGIKVDSIQPKEVLPHKTGVSFLINFGQYNQNQDNQYF